MYDHRSYSIGQEAAADAENGYVKRLQCPAAGTDSSGTTSCLINATKNNQAANRSASTSRCNDAVHEHDSGCRKLLPRSSC